MNVGIQKRIVAIAKGDTGPVLYGAAEEDGGQGRAAVESQAVNAGDAVRDSDVGQAGTVLKSPIANVGNAVWDGDIGQAGASEESRLANVGDAVREEQPLKAPSMLVMPFMRVILVRPEQPPKAP